MKKIIWGAVGVVAAVVIIALVWLYAGKFNDARAKAFKALALPVAFVNTQPVSGREFMARFELAQALYKDEPSYNAAETQIQILDQLMENAKLKSLTAKHDVEVSREEIDAQYKAVIDQFSAGDETKFNEMLTQAYQLTPQQFKDEVLAIDILRTNLTVWFNSQKDLNKAAYDQVDSLIAKLDQGQSFEDVVKAYTQDEATKDFGGDTGFVKVSELAPEFQQPLSNAKADDRLIIVSRYGLHIVKVIEVDKSGDEPSYHLQQLFVQIEGFDEWYAQQAGAIKAHRLIKF